MVVNRQRSEGGNVDFEFHFRSDLGGKFGIQSVNSFNNQNLVVFKAYCLSTLRVVFACFEIISGQSDCFAGYEAAEVGIEAFDVDGIQRLIVVFAVLINRSAVTVDEIVVKRNQARHNEIRDKLNSQPL